MTDIIESLGFSYGKDTGYAWTSGDSIPAYIRDALNWAMMENNY